ncbi:MAG TPA: IS1595 family transposase, partial [Terriglobia bacterium]|nr:IS1595 family transposase [Terriglobia bacterium]HLI30738.1 IS1595 family transposase [Terriglobia bacterium]
SKFNGVKKNFDLHLKECEWRWAKKTHDLFRQLAIIAKNHPLC